VSAIVTWVYPAGFGVPTVPVAIYLMKQFASVLLRTLRHVRRALSRRFGDGTFAVLLTSYLLSPRPRRGGLETESLPLRGILGGLTGSAGVRNDAWGACDHK
jgi:hypothetical protein